MKTRKDVIDKLALARGLYAEICRVTKDVQNPALALEATKFYASIRVLEWVLEKEVLA